MSANPTHPRFGRWVSVLTLVSVLLLIHLVHFAVAMAAPNPPPVQIYYVPVPEDQVFAAFTSIYPGGAADKCNLGSPDVASPIHSYVSISVISAGTIVYYDQWEDDFEIDMAHPVQLTTQIWGDANPANGAPPDIPSDVLAPDTVIVLNNAVPVPRQPANLFFDGGDKIGASRPVAMTRATWSGSYPQAPGTLLADALEVYDTSRWGTRHQAPVGVGTATNQLFEYTGVAIMAAQDNTTVTLDANADLVAEAAIVLNEGESYLVDGGIQAGTLVNASAPVQVALITGDVCDIYESRWFVLFPTERWSGSYYSPVGTPTGGGGTTIWLFNPGATPLGVSWEISSGVQAPLTIAPLSAISAVVPNNSGAHFFTAGGAPFAALATVGADSPAPGDNSRADWGFALIPDSQLTYQTLVGWGAGRDPTSSVKPDENGSPVWVIPVLRDGGEGPVAVCVDYNGNNHGPLTDPYGFKYDRLLSLAKLQSQQIFDPDGDQTGMVLYVCDPPGSPTGAELATAWGQAPGIASAAEPGLDLGTTAPPAATFEAGKGAEIAGDADHDGKADPGDLIQYTIIVRNASRVPLTTVHLSDTLPAYTTYITSSTFVGMATSVAPVADNPNGTPFPLDEGGIDLPGLPVLGVYTVTFGVRVNFPLPPDLDRVRNVAFVQVGEDTQQPEVETPVDLDAGIAITKYTNGDNADMPPGPVLAVGAPVTWTYVITNTGTVTLTAVRVTDNISGVAPLRIQGVPDADGNMPLSAVWVYQAMGIATAGQYSNTGLVTALGLNQEPAGATDLSHYFGLRSGIGLRKIAAPTVVYPGAVVTYTYAVSNTGNAALATVVLSDDRCAPVTRTGGNPDGNALLEPSEVWSYRCTLTVTHDITNTATATAQDPLSRTLTAQDMAFVNVLVAQIDLVKEASARAVYSGTTVVYTFTVTNVGDEPLSNVSLADDRCAPLTPVVGGSGSLPIGGTWVYRCAAVIVEDTTNIAVVTALDPRGNVVTDMDTWTVDIPIYYIPIIITPPQPCPPPDGCPLAYTKGFAVDEGRNLLYVTSRNPDRLLVVNPDSAQIMASTATGAQPWGVVADERTGRIYVSNFAGGDVWVYDAATLAVLAKIAVGPQPTLMEILPDLDTVFVVVRGGSRIAVIQGLLKVQEVGSGGSGPYGIAADPVNQRIFVSNRDSSHLATLRKVGSLWEAHSNVVFDDGRTLFDIAYNPDNERLYAIYAAADGQWYVGVWKPSDSGLWGNEATIPVGDGGAVDSPLVGGSGLVVNPITGNVFNVNTAGRSLSVIDGTQNRVTTTIALGDDPFPAAVNTRTRTVFVGLRTPGRLIKIAD